MRHTPTTPSIERMYDNVNPPVNSQLPLFSDSMIHHNTSLPSKGRIVYTNSKRILNGYGVSSSRRILSVGLFNARYELVREFLEYVLDFSTAQREVTLRLLRLWAYYGNVYPKESTVTADVGCSKATYWRTVRILRDLGLIRVINRFLCRPHAQISNFYRFDKLLLAIARYLAEHGVGFKEKWLKPYLTMWGCQFWPWLLGEQGSFLHDTS